MSSQTRFIFIVCQLGAENTLKTEIAAQHPELKFAFSKSGFLTFKLDPEHHWPEKFILKSTFARAYGWSLGKLEGTDGKLLASTSLKQFLEVAERHAAATEASKSSKAPKKNPSGATSRNPVSSQAPERAVVPSRTPLRGMNLHVWERDSLIPGQKGFEPGVSVLAEEVGEVLTSVPHTLNAEGHWTVGAANDLSVSLSGQPNGSTDPPEPTHAPTTPCLQIRINQPAAIDSLVFDLVLVEPNQWWIGYHYAVTPPGRWPGGVPLIQPKNPPISRAYFKAAEALAWSGINIQPGQWCAEIGSAPGGCCQLLLEKGAKVIGIDPAEMDPSITQHPNFVHLRKRGNEVKKKEFANVKWLFADINIVPNYTLDTITEIVNNQHVHIQGLVLTMKLADWSLADQIPAFRKRIGEAGFKLIKTRQLAFNRREFCLVAVKDKFVLRKNRKYPVSKVGGRPPRRTRTKSNKPTPDSPGSDKPAE
jgi:23S rRNA (cytidine2498-2'-O)-methyltransferase